MNLPPEIQQAIQVMNDSTSHGKPLQQAAKQFLDFAPKVPDEELKQFLTSIPASRLSVHILGKESPETNALAERVNRILLAGESKKSNQRPKLP